MTDSPLTFLCTDHPVHMRPDECDKCARATMAQQAARMRFERCNAAADRIYTDMLLTNDSVELVGSVAKAFADLPTDDQLPVMRLVALALAGLVSLITSTDPALAEWVRRGATQIQGAIDE